MAYRRKQNNDRWHFCTNCSNWPTKNYIESTSRPTYGELCDKCKDKENNGNCGN